MRAFVTSLIVLAVVAVGSNLILRSLPLSSADVRTSEDVRLDE
jgi:hypothetical protein